PPSVAYESGREIDLKAPAVKHRVNALRIIVTQRSTHPREQFASTEWFRQVVIPPRVERVDLLLFAIAHTQDDNRHSAPLAQSLEHAHSIQVWQAEIEQHNVRPALGSLGQSVVPCGRLDDPVPIRLKSDAQQPPDLRLIINDQYGRSAFEGSIA